MKRFRWDSDVHIFMSHGVCIQLTMQVFMVGGGSEEPISLRKCVLYGKKKTGFICVSVPLSSGTVVGSDGPTWNETNLATYVVLNPVGSIKDGSVRERWVRQQSPTVWQVVCGWERQRELNYYKLTQLGLLLSHTTTPHCRHSAKMSASCPFVCPVVHTFA